MEALYRILENRLLGAKSRSLQYSQRAMAKRLGLSSGALSEILKRKRKISPKLAERLAEKMQLSPAERRAVGLRVESKLESEFELSSDSFHLISDWWHFAILNLTQVEGFKSDPLWIAGRLGLPKSKINSAIDLLKRSGLLIQLPNGNLKRTHSRLRTSDNIRNLAIQKAHRLDLELIDRSLNLPVNTRDLTSVTMTIDPEMLPRLREIIRKFEDELTEEAESVRGKEVYRLAIHLFPLTKVDSKGEKS